MSMRDLRSAYHREISARIICCRNGMCNLGDVSSNTSRTLARNVINRMGYPTGSQPLADEEARIAFCEITKDFLNEALRLLAHSRRSDWTASLIKESPDIVAFGEGKRLAPVLRLLKAHDDLSATLEDDYVITPHIIVTRAAMSDNEVGPEAAVGRDAVSGLPPGAAGNRAQTRRVLGAAISCKWSLPRARTEALNLIRNRKGKTPHIVAVVAEPMPTRLASLAMGTGDIDCVYHMALPELRAAATECGFEDQADMLETLVAGRRLRDIGDLPFDLIA